MVGDLGLGKTVDMSSRLTMIAGTPTFVAPEQAQGERIDARADQYSLAALTYLLLTGRPPHATPPSRRRRIPGSPSRCRRRTGRSRPRSRPSYGVGSRPTATTRWPTWRPSPRRSPTRPALSGPGPAGSRGCSRSTRDRTQPGARPSPLTAQPPLPGPTPPPVRRRRRVLLAARRSGAAGRGGAIGYAAWQGLDGTTTLSDSRSTLTVTVPDDWDPATATDGWQPPDSDTTYPALSVGSSSDWETSGGEGVFVGVLPGTKLPTSVPGHPECGSVEGTIDDDNDGDRSKTVYYTDCPFVTVERVVQVAANRLLWVQVRADSRSTAVDVLDSVVTHGL